MQHSQSILSDGHVYNSPRGLDPSRTGTLKPKLKHSSNSNESQDLSINTSSNDTNESTSTSNSSMEERPNESEPSSDPRDTLSVNVDALIRTLEESLKEPGQHCISNHDIVEAYNVLSMKIRNCSPDMTQDPTPRVPPPMFQLSEDESTTLFNSLMRDIGRALPSLFETQPQDDSCTDLPPIVIEEEDIQDMIEDSLVCEYALSLASDILIHPVLHCNFTEDQLGSLFHYILSICTAQESTTTFNREKHVAAALFILKVQKLPLSVLTSMKDSIVSALRSTLSEKNEHKYGKIDALTRYLSCDSCYLTCSQVIPVFLREHPACASWFTFLIPTILNHLTSDNPEISLNSAWALASFASAKMCTSSVPQPTDPQITNAIRSYLKQETSKRLPSPAANSFHSFFKAAIQNDSRWGGLGPSFALTVIATMVVLLDHSLFSIPECLKPIFLLLQECGASRLNVVRSGQREVWRAVFWAYSRIPHSSDVTGDSKVPSKKERAFRVVSQDLSGKRRRIDLLDFLLRPDKGETESNRSENDVRRAIRLVALLFEKGESAASRLEGVSILSRMVASIGSPSIELLHREPGELPFAPQIIDGSFLLKGTAEFNPVPVDVLIERLPPLTETEVLQHWDAICSTWVSIVQKVLDCSGELSAPIQQIWQALLLVKADVQGQQLSSSALFSSTIISIIQTFSVRLDSVSSQLCYLSCIKKLWTVMKNVFERSWLSLPGEKILVIVLKHQFTVSDDRVKESWSQICADLISVGVPDLLRLLRCRHENREEEEITRQLWTVLAKNDSAINDEQSSEALVDLLLMPFGVWSLSPAECELWERILGRICTLRRDKGQTNNQVVSFILSCCDEPKLDSLKKSPRILHCLLEQSTQSSSVPCSTTSLQILSWMDDSLSRAYGIAAEKSWAVDSLRLIGKVISSTGESDIVRLLCAVQQSLSLWIADEERQLDEQEDQELVNALYTKSLEILARVEPSITILHELETFLHCVFLRIRGQGPLVFLDFWRSTYHTRKDLPKHEYPPLIRQCLKAWADVTNNSFGDGFSLDSGSQSLRSFTIPDSQPENADVDQMEFDLDPFVKADSALLVTAHDYSQEPLSRGSATPIAGQRSMRGADSSAPAFLDSQHHDGHYVDDESKMISLGSVASSSKRRAQSDPPRTPKRPRMEEEAQFDTPERKNKGKAKADDFEDSIESYANSALNDSPSRPLDRSSSFTSRRSGSSTQHSRAWKKRKISDNTTSVLQESRPSPSRPVIRRSPQDRVRRTSEDYDSWEQPISAKDLKVARKKNHVSSDLIVPDSEELRRAEQEGGDDEETDHFESDDILSPSLGEYPYRSRVRERSQTAPELEHPQTFSPLPASRPLKRNRTTQDSLEHRKATSAQLDVLQRAYAVVADTGASQVDVQDIMQAKRLLNQINLVLDEQMYRKTGSSARPDEDKDAGDMA